MSDTGKVCHLCETVIQSGQSRQMGIYPDLRVVHRTCREAYQAGEQVGVKKGLEQAAVILEEARNEYESPSWDNALDEAQIEIRKEINP